MLVSEWMTRDPLTLAPADAIATAAQLMSRHRVRRIPLCAAGHLVGIVTKGDVLAASPPEVNPFAADAPSAPALARPLETIMTAPAVSVATSAPIEEAAQVMIDRKIGGLAVVKDHALVGILTKSDLFRAFTAALGGSTAALRITFDVAAGEDVVPFVAALARKHGMRVASVATFARESGHAAVVRLLGHEPRELVEELWTTGHRVQSVLRTQGLAAPRG
jgi:acetoin utilization protein AcuB